MSNLRVVMIAGEAVPFAKVGGLGDVLGALPLALEKLGVSVTVVIPRHSVIDLQKFGFEPYPVPGQGRAQLGLESIPFDLHRARMPNSSVDLTARSNATHAIILE